MSKLLAWRDALFLVRWERGELQLQRVGVDTTHKTISLHLCTATSNNEAVVLPVDARLVAVNEVEDSTLALRYPVLVFLSPQEAGQNLSTSGNRRRSVATRGAVGFCNIATPSPTSWLVVCMLDAKEGVDKLQWRFLNMLEVPRRLKDADAVVFGGSNATMLQVFVMDGPHVLLFERRSQHMMLFNLYRAMQADKSFGDHEALDVIHDVKDDALDATCEVVSCTYVSELHSTRPHILIHMLRRSSSSSSDRHTWSVVNLDHDRGDIISNKKALLCHYLPTTRCIGPMSKFEQISCCCFVFEKSQSDYIALPSCGTDAFAFWDLVQPTQTDIGVSTLVVTGTTSNTIYVHASGILLVSYVLPARPTEIWPLCENNLDQRHVLCVRCDDEHRSFFMLEFISNVQHASLKLLLSFKHVGHAYNGNFAGANESDSSTQVLLLNDVRGIFGINDCMYTIGNGADAYKFLDYKQLVKRTVLISQKSSSLEIMLSCHRLRRHEEKHRKDGSRFRKRSRNNEDVRFGDLKATPFCYIERTQKASSRDESVNHFEPIKEGAALAASHAQLGKLADSLFARLDNGLQELERLQIIMSDKNALAHQLNQLIVRLWQRLQAKARNSSKAHICLLPFCSAQEVDSYYLRRAEMETIVPTTIVGNGAKDGPSKQDSESLMNDLKLEQQVCLKRLTLLEYVPSSSLVRAEVVLLNMSDFVINDSYVFLTAPKGGPISTQGWMCLSSVAIKFIPARSMTENSTTQQEETCFQLDFQFVPSYLFRRERKPLEVMLWLHWGPSQDDLISNTTLAWHHSESALAIASVKIYPEDLIKIDKELPTIVRSSWSEQQQLLFISSGSNLVSWCGQTCAGIPASTDFVIRPTFALISSNVKSRKVLLYELSKLVANLPSDVFVMHNPFQHTHLGVLRRILCSMHQEIITYQELQDKQKLNKECGAGNKHTASSHRAMQCDTDLRVNWLLQRLQERVNFHLMLF